MRLLPLLTALTLGCAAPAPIEGTSPEPMAAAATTTPAMPSPSLPPGAFQADDVALTFPDGWHLVPAEPPGRLALAGPARDFRTAPRAFLYRAPGAKTVEDLRKAVAIGGDGFREAHPGFVRRVEDVDLGGTPGRRAWTVTRLDHEPGGDDLRLDVVAFRGGVGYWLVFMAGTTGDDHVARSFGLEAMAIAGSWRWLSPTAPRS